MPSQFRDLAAYRLSVALADDLCKAVELWPRRAQWSIGDQLIRAAESVGANIAESSGRWYPADKRRLLFVARGSLYETEHWIARAHSRGLLNEDLSERVAEIAKTLNGLIKKPSPS